MVKTWKRIVTGALAGWGLIWMTSGCSSISAIHGSQVDKYIQEYNSAYADAVESSEQQLQQTRTALLEQFNSEILPEALWQPMALNPALASQIASQVPLIKILREELGDTAGYTEAELREQIAAQVQSGQLPDQEYSSDYVDLYRMLVLTSNAESGTNITEEQIDTINQRYLEETSGVASRLDGTVDQQLSAVFSQRFTVYTPQVAAGVNLQGQTQAEKSVLSYLSQYYQQQ